MVNSTLKRQVDVLMLVRPNLYVYELSSKWNFFASPSEGFPASYHTKEPMFYSSWYSGVVLNQTAWQVRITLQPQVSSPYRLCHQTSTWRKPKAVKKTHIISDQEQLQIKPPVVGMKDKNGRLIPAPSICLWFSSIEASFLKHCGHLCFSQVGTLSLASGSALYTGEQWNEMAPISILSPA